MNTKLLLAVLFCFAYVGWSFPLYSNQCAVRSAGTPRVAAADFNTRSANTQMANTANADMSITDQVKRELALNSDFANIKVETKQGVVTLTGTVSDQNAKATIGEKVANIPGVTSVDNKIEVNQ